MRVIDSHTGGEPTRVVLDGGPDLGDGSLAERAQRLATEHEGFYQGLLREPRGQTGMVGALLTPPVDPDCVAGVIYFDADAVLGMCGHGTIGLGATLAHLGRMTPGAHRIETPVGVVGLELIDANTVAVTNIESRRVRQNARIAVDGHGEIVGDVAYGGNWFFIVDPSPIPIETRNIRALTDLAIAIRETANAQGVGGEAGEPIDHVILQGPSPEADAHGRNFVLCPDDAFDRSPCGTGSSALLACLAAEDRLAPDVAIIQESVIGSRYRLSYRPGAQGGVIARIQGQAWVMADSRMVFAPTDPFEGGIAY